MTPRQRAAVAAMLARYRQLQARNEWDWGEDFRLVPGHMGFLLPAAWPVEFLELLRSDWHFAEVAATGADPAVELANAIEAAVPRGVVLVRRDGEARAVAGPPKFALADRACEVTVLVIGEGRSRFSRVMAEAGAERMAIPLEGGEMDAPAPLTWVAQAALVLESDDVCQWSVGDERGGGWFGPRDARRWDRAGRPWFHAKSRRVDVPAARLLKVACGRGMEFERLEEPVRLEAGEEQVLRLSPRRLFSPGSWLSADLHVHLNYSGDLVAEPDDVRVVQRGQALGFVNVVAASINTDRVYDQELMESGAAGVEYRNDLLGHVVAIGPTSPPSEYAGGHEHSSNATDDRPLADVLRELRSLGAAVVFGHPFWSGITVDGDWRPIDASNPRSMEARELPIDAALGLVDGLDVLSNGATSCALVAYRHLLNCGIRLAATAGTDSMLSFSHGLNSDPPGWARTYLRLEPGAAEVESIVAAIRAGRTIATTGPWLELDVDGHGPGEQMTIAVGSVVRVRASGENLVDGELELHGPDGVLALARSNEGRASIDAEIRVDEPIWLTVVVQGDRYAVASPVFVDRPESRGVARRASAEWCLGWIDAAADLYERNARVSGPAAIGRFVALADEARAYFEAVRERAPA